MTSYMTGRSSVDIRTIAVRAVVTAFEAALAVLLASGLTDLSPEVYQTALTAGLAAGLSIIYNAARSYLDTQD
jgi:hypothetical protein